MLKQSLNLRSQSGIGAEFRQKARALFRRTLESLGNQRFRDPPLLRKHGPFLACYGRGWRCKWWRSHNFAVTSSRLTVAQCDRLTQREFIDRQPTKKSQLDDPRLTWIECREIRQRVMQGQDLDVETTLRIRHVGEHKRVTCEPFALGGSPPPGVIDQDTSHRLSGDAVEMAAILPMDPLLAAQPDICLVDECRRLQRVARPLPAEIGRCKLPELSLHGDHQQVPSLA